MNWWKSPINRQRVNQLTDPYCRFQSIEELQKAARLGVRIDVNRAEVDDWLRLPGISIRQARSIVTLRQSGVQFHCLEDVAAALGVSVERLRPLEPILLFCYYDPDRVETAPLVNPNVASIEQLTKVAAIDLFLARAIVQNRNALGRYRDMADLQHRLRLPAALTEQLIHSLKI